MKNSIIILALGLILCLSFALANGANESNSNEVKETPIPTLYGAQQNSPDSNFLQESLPITDSNSRDSNYLPMHPPIRDLNDTITPAFDSNKPAQIRHEDRIRNMEQLIGLDRKLTDLNSVKQLREELRKEFVNAVQDDNEMIKEQLRAVRVSISRILSEAVKQNPQIDFEEMKGFGEQIRMDANQIIVDSNNIIQARRELRTMINERVIEVRNTQSTLEINDGNISVPVRGEITIDDNGLSLNTKPINIVPSRIQERLSSMERIELRIETDAPVYDAQLANTRNFLGLIPLSSTENALINAQNGRIVGYNKPWWSAISTGNDLIEANEVIE